MNSFESIKRELWDEEIYRVKNQVRGQVENFQAWDQVSSQVCNQVWDQVMGRMKNQISAYLYDLVKV